MTMTENRNNVTLSLVVPCFNEEKNIALFVSTCKEVFARENISFDMICVNDGSRDGTEKVLEELYSREDNIHFVNFSRNFGKEAAMLAGLDRAWGDYVTFIDADMQQRPETVVEMLRILQGDDSLDCVAAYQEQRHEGALTAFCKKMFYRFINRVSEAKFYPNASDFRVFRQNVAQTMRDLPECYRFTKGIFAWIGFRTRYIPYVASERNAGQTSWSFRKLVKYSVEGITNYATSFLKWPIYIGGIMSGVSFLWMLIHVICSLCGGETVLTRGMLLGVMLFFFGLQTVFIGVMGLYLGKLYMAQKGRPVYIVRSEFVPRQNEKERS